MAAGAPMAYLAGRAVSRRLPDTFEGLTDEGWPRPRWLDGEGRMLPVPWITPVPDFASTDPMRRLQTQANRSCQVCGYVHSRHEEVIVFLNGGLWHEPGHRPRNPDDWSKVLLRAIDDAVMHQRCARLAAGNCPKLKRMRAEGNLWAFAGPADAVKEYEDREKPLEANPAGRAACRELGISDEFQTYLAMTGLRARIFTL